MNHTSDEATVRSVLDWFATTRPPEAGAAASQDGGDRRSTSVGEDRWLNIGAFTTAELRAVPLFKGLSPQKLECVGRWARKVKVAEGRPVTTRWDSARDFYVVLDGVAEVQRDGEVIAERGPGEFFGELAALDWGAGFGYARLATVVARTPLRMLALAPAHLNRLMAIA